MKISEKLINEFKSALSSEGLRFTDQRLLILEDMLSSSDHRDCNEIYQSLSEIFSESISDLSNEVKDVILHEGNKIYQEMLSDKTKNKLITKFDKFRFFLLLK